MPQSLLNRVDQSTLATIAAVLLAGAVVAWVVAGGGSENTIHIDRAEPLDYQFLVDVNTAEWAELAQLPDVGEILARRIIATRESRGPYRSAEELLEVRGIGRVKLSQITPFLVPLPDDRAVVDSDRSRTSDEEASTGRG